MNFDRTSIFASAYYIAYNIQPRLSQASVATAVSKKLVMQKSKLLAVESRKDILPPSDLRSLVSRLLMASIHAKPHTPRPQALDNDLTQMRSLEQVQTVQALKLASRTTLGHALRLYV